MTRLETYELVCVVMNHKGAAVYRAAIVNRKPQSRVSEMGRVADVLT